MTDLQINACLDAVRRGLELSAEMQVPCSIAIVDSGRNLVAFARGEGAMLGSAELARNKAFTAASFKMKTSAVSDVSQPGAPLFGLDTAGDRPFVIFGGGVPVVREAEMIGAVGVSGGAVEEDERIAETVVAALLA